MINAYCTAHLSYPWFRHIRRILCDTAHRLGHGTVMSAGAVGREL
jgi:hypothetical protein